MDQGKLKRFIHQVLNFPDTPTLIQWVAGEQDRMALCFAIMQEDERSDDTFQVDLAESCRSLGVSPDQVRIRIAPVACSLGLTSCNSNVDYYEVLGVSPHAEEAQIRSAFRSQAHRLHPDKRKSGDSGVEEFITLNIAYQTLSDPEQRHQYDLSRAPRGSWQESFSKPKKAPARSPARRIRLFLQLGIVLVILIVCAVVFDQIYRDQSLRQGRRPTATPSPTDAVIQADTGQAAGISQANGKLHKKMHGPVARGVEPQAPIHEEKTPSGITNTDNNSISFDSESAQTGINPVTKYPNSVMPDLIQHPVITLDSGLHRNDEREVLNRRSNKTALDSGRQKPARAASRTGSTTHDPLTPAPLVQNRQTSQSPVFHPNPNPGKYQKSSRSTHGGTDPASVQPEAGQDENRSTSPRVNTRSASQIAATDEKHGPRIMAGDAADPHVDNIRDRAAAPEKTISMTNTRPPFQLISGDAVQRFLNRYTQLYAARNLDAFLELFTAGATENGQAIRGLAPVYRQSFDNMRRIEFTIALQRHTVKPAEHAVHLKGRYLLSWFRPEGTRRFSDKGIIEMVLISDQDDNVQVKQMSYYKPGKGE